MARELVPQLVKQFDWKELIRRDLAGEMTDPHVLGENPRDERLMRIEMAGTGGEQDFFLLAEVLTPVGFPIGEKAVARISCTGRIGTPEALRNHQRVMVIAGKFFERGVTFHFS